MNDGNGAEKLPLGLLPTDPCLSGWCTNRPHIHIQTKHAIRTILAAGPALIEGTRHVLIIVVGWRLKDEGGAFIQGIAVCGEGCDKIWVFKRVRFFDHSQHYDTRPLQQGQLKAFIYLQSAQAPTVVKLRPPSSLWGLGLPIR